MDWTTVIRNQDRRTIEALKTALGQAVDILMTLPMEQDEIDSTHRFRAMTEPGWAAPEIP